MPPGARTLEPLSLLLSYTVLIKRCKILVVRLSRAVYCAAISFLLILEAMTVAPRCPALGDNY